MTETRAAVFEALRKKYQVELETAYDRACKRAQAKGRLVYAKNDHYSTWGYKHPMDGPNATHGLMNGVYYAGDPCLMPIGAGMAGACVAGTCSGGVAAGGCRAPGCGNGGGCTAGPSGCGGTGGACGGSGGGGCGSTGKW